MSPDPFANARILTGPTGSGKTELALALAERLGAEIVALDSMTLYRGLSIGTAKPTVAERQRVPHHLIDVLEPWESASVAWWLERAAACCREIEGRGKNVLFVGGTALYLKALLYGIFDGPPANAGLRERLGQEPPARLHERLGAVDPEAARRLHVNDVRRVIRALEVWELTGRPISSWQSQWGPGNETVGVAPTAERETQAVGRCLYLDLPRAVLYERINARVARMIADGLVEEVRQLRELPLPLSREATQALGYKEILTHLDGQATLSETIEGIQVRTRHFARRQLTWFRHIAGCRPTSAELTLRMWTT